LKDAGEKSMHFGFWPVCVRACVCVHEHWWSGFAAPFFPAMICGRMARVRAMLKWLAASLTMNQSSEVLIEALLGLKM
jgi:hypothetical protein